MGVAYVHVPSAGASSVRAIALYQAPVVTRMSEPGAASFNRGSSLPSRDAMVGTRQRHVRFNPLQRCLSVTVLSGLESCCLWVRYISDLWRREQCFAGVHVEAVTKLCPDKGKLRNPAIFVEGVSGACLTAGRRGDGASESVGDWWTARNRSVPAACR